MGITIDSLGCRLHSPAGDEQRPGAGQREDKRLEQADHPDLRHRRPEEPGEARRLHHHILLGQDKRDLRAHLRLHLRRRGGGDGHKRAPRRRLQRRRLRLPRRRVAHRRQPAPHSLAGQVLRLWEGLREVRLPRRDPGEQDLHSHLPRARFPLLRQDRQRRPEGARGVQGLEPGLQGLWMPGLSRRLRPGAVPDIHRWGVLPARGL